MNFTYVVSKPPDMTFGALKPDGNWTGMIGELVYQNADIGKVFNCYNWNQRYQSFPFASNTVGPPVVTNPNMKLGQLFYGRHTGPYRSNFEQHSYCNSAS